MKKLALMAIPFLFAACNNGKTAATVENADSVTNDSVYYEGTVPAADGPGIKYEIALAADSTNGFRLTSTYLEAEDGKDVTFVSNGQVETVKADGKEDTFYKLSSGENETVIFKVVGDSILRMVNDEFEEATGGMNYDLKKK